MATTVKPSAGEGVVKATLESKAEDKDEDTKMSEADLEALADKVAAKVSKAADEPKDDGDSKMEAADASLEAMISTHRGDTLADEKVRGSLRDLRLELRAGNKPALVIVDTAKSLINAHFDSIAEDGADEGAKLDAVRPTQSGFDVGKYLLGVMREGKTVEDPDQLAGSPEAEMLKGTFAAGGDRAEALRARFDEARALAKGGSAVIPVPLSAIGVGSGASLAQTYGNGTTNVDGYRSDDYRPDLLTPFHRPPESLNKLGVMQISVSNDINVPRVTAAQTAAWLAENGEAADQDLTVGSTKSNANRLAAKTDISWQLTAAADEIGITPLVVSELNRTMMQERERAAFGKGATNAPTGLAGATGVNDPGVNAAPTTLAHIYAFEQALLEDNIDMSNLRWLLSVEDSVGLAQRLTFTASSAMAAVPMYRTAMDMGPAGMMGGYDGFVVGRPACASNNVPKNLSSSDNHTGVFLGDWRYLLVIDYMMAFVTIDDISQARSAQTRCTINSYHDVITRFPQAFAVDTHA